MKNTLFLDALACKNRGRPPVWLMRQAGRFLPEYRALREKHSLYELFHNSELACQVTRLPLDILGVDAAILFSDILVLVEAFGFKLQFPEGSPPVVEPLLQTPDEVRALSCQNLEERLAYVFDTIRLLKPDLNVPLIGFSGGPFTVASYMIDKCGSKDLKNTKTWLYTHPESFHQLLEKLTQATIAYLKLQVAAGVDAVQVFDSWANVLNYEQFQACSLHYLKKIIDALHPTPVILFSRGSSLFPKELAALEPRAISFDWQQDLATLRTQVPKHIAVQGNLDPHLLTAPRPLIESATRKLLASMQHQSGFIANLGHGVLPHTPVDHVRHFIDTIKAIS